MKYTRLIPYLISLTLLLRIIAPAQIGGDNSERKILILADNQEHLLTGVPFRAMGPWADKLITSVAVRSPLANVGGRLLLAEALQFGQREKADLVLHLGDASDISCPDELTSVFDALDKNAPGAWFMAPGNHDGILAGNFTRFQPSYGLDIKKEPPIYDGQPRQAHKGKKRGWFNACLSPTNLDDPSRADVLTKGDATRLYVNRLKSRIGASSKRLEPEKIRIDNTDVICEIETVEIESQNYAAVARICPRTPVAGTAKWVGPFASFIIQRLDVVGSRIVLLDTSNYTNPSLVNVALKGSVSTAQMERAEEFFTSIPREKIIVAGHHPLDNFPANQKKGIIQKSSRYISAHVHWSAQLIAHEDNQLKTRELNIGSVHDYPPQAVVAKISSGSIVFRVAGADAAKTQWSGFLEQCETRRDQWKFEDKFCQGYTRGSYVAHLLETLRTASVRHNTAVASPAPLPEIPRGDKPGDWLLLDQALQAIRATEGESRTFWACQAYYASEATKLEAAELEKLIKRAGLSTKSGADATGPWFGF